MKKTKKVKFLEREAVVLTEELKKQVEARVKETLDACNKKWKLKLAMPEIRFDLKSLCAGIAMPGFNVLRFHPIYLVENETDYIRETVPHEVAHIVAKFVAPLLRKEDPSLGNGKLMSHGKEWRIVMEFLGRGPKDGQSWKDVIKHVYDPSSIHLPPRKKLGPRKPGGRKVGEIIAKIGTLKPDELEALKQRLGFEIGQHQPSEQEIILNHEFSQLAKLVGTKFNDIPLATNHRTPAGHAIDVIEHLAKAKKK